MNSPTRHIDIDPKSARTVIHEVHARHRGPVSSNTSEDTSVREARPPQYGDERDRKIGVLPNRNLPSQRRLNTIDDRGMFINSTSVHLDH